MSTIFLPDTKFCTSISPTVDIQTAGEVDIWAKIIPKNHTQLTEHQLVFGCLRLGVRLEVIVTIVCIYKLFTGQQPTSIGVNLCTKYQPDMPDSGREYPLCLKLIS